MTEQLTDSRGEKGEKGGGTGRRNCIRGQPTWRGTRVCVSLGLAALAFF